MSNLSAFPYIGERSEATPGLWNNPFSIISANIAALNSDLTINFPSGNTLSVFSSIDASQHVHAGEAMGIGPTPSAVTTGTMTIAVSSAQSDYIHFEDTSGLKSDYLIGSRVGGTADGLNIYDLSGQTMIASFSKQSVRFFQNVVGPVFDVGGALADTYNAATFGGSTITVQIQAAISQASIDGVRRVYVPANMYPYDPRQMSFDTRVQMVREGGAWDVYDAQAYGANPSLSVADAWSTTAIQAAMHGAHGAGGGIVYIPVGTYGISGISLSRRVTLRGAGSARFLDSTNISQLYQGSASTTMISLVDTGGSGVVIEGLTLSSSGNNANRGGIRIVGMAFCLFRGITVSGTSEFGVEYLGGRDMNFNAIQDSAFATTSRCTIINVSCNSTLVCDSNPYITGCYFSITPPAALFSFQSVSGGVAPDSPLIIGNRAISGSSFTLLYGQMSNARFIENRFETVAGQMNVLLDPPSTEPAGRFIGNLYAAPTGLVWTDSATAPSGRFQETTTFGTINAIPGLIGSPPYGFASEGSLGLFRSAISTIGLTYGSLAIPAGSATTPSLNFSSESSLGWYRSTTSTMALSYGTLALAAGSQYFMTGAGSLHARLTNATGALILSVNRTSAGAQDSAANASWLLQFNANTGSGDGVIITHANPGGGFATQWSLDSRGNTQTGSGTALLPSHGFLSETSLGFYRSAASTMALSYGTMLVNGPMWSSGISVGGGTLIPQISSMSSLVGAFVVQGSASSFTGITWAAAGIGDIILCAPFQSTAASSISSGLVPHSFVTVAGQIEFRLSNVSTLVQNQSAQTWVFTRIRPF